MQVSMLNLARKWRAHNFDTLVGQDLVVKILKNSLYIGHYFPVYLFSGQRGCGKTSTARIFGAALNCERLPDFQLKPKDTVIPCGSCESCIAMAQFRHPDFIEIDAASHTGVDNMRTIIDAAYYLPVLGRKKIYLIDEAHMLSKAAFNAMLKIFEEPPMHAHFILATTDPEKIIETVRSRCFSLFFGSIDITILAEHLKYICIQENIEYADEALHYIARVTDGSARDAINILETARFSHSAITLDAVLQVLGHVDDQQLAQLLLSVAQGNIKEFLSVWSSSAMQRASAHHVWSGLVRLVRGITWYRYGVNAVDVPASFIEQFLSMVSLKQCAIIMEALYQIEPLFIRSSNQRALLEFTLLQLCSRFRKKTDDSSYGQSGLVSVAQPKEEDTVVDEEESEEDTDDDEDSVDDEAAEIVMETVSSSSDAQLNLCRQACAQLGDPLIASVLSQIVTITHDSANNRLLLHVPSQFSFFADMIHGAQALWMPLVNTVYAHNGIAVVIFDAVVEQAPISEKRVTAVASAKPVVRQQIPSQAHIPEKKQSFTPRYEQKPEQRGASYARRAKAVVEKTIDVSDIQRWPLTNRVLSYFPGTVTVVDEARL